MFKWYLLLFTCIGFIGCTKDREIFRKPIPLESGSSLLYYWDFNNNSGAEAKLEPSYEAIPGMTNFKFYMGDKELSFCDNDKTSCFDSVNDGDDQSTLMNSTPGSALRLRNPCSHLDIHFSTLNFTLEEFNYSIKRTGSGAQKNIIQYSTDGISFTSLGLREHTFDVREEYSKVHVDLSAVVATRNRNSVVIRILFKEGNLNNSGNNRLDNLTITGRSL